jgi:hypothetical protein
MTVNTVNPIALTAYCADLRDDARALVTGPAMEREHGTQATDEWFALAADLATITSSLVGEYVDSLDPVSRRVVELSLCNPMCRRSR